MVLIAVCACCSTSSAFTRSPPGSPRTRASTAEESKMTLDIVSFAPCPLVAFLKKLVQNALETAALGHNRDPHHMLDKLFRSGHLPPTKRNILCAIEKFLKTNSRRHFRVKFAAALAATIGLALLTSCGSSGGTSIIPPVIAQSGYSNASITGTYSLSLASPFNPAGGDGFAEGIGSFVADGAGNITSGTLMEHFAGSEVCSWTFTGTYSLQSNASGTASIIEKPTVVSGTSSCGANQTLPFWISAGQQGASFLLGESDGNSLLSGSAIKQ